MDFKNKHEEGIDRQVNLHEGHRNRLRERLDREKFTEIDEYQVLEYLLTLVVKRKDTNELAHTLVNTFGSFSNVCDSEIEDLMTVKGVSKTIAYFLHSIPFLFRNYKISKLKPKASLSCPQDIFNYLGECIYHLPKEEFYFICLDHGGKVITQKIIAIGGNSQVAVNLKDAVQFAIKVNASKVVMLHNHPTGDVVPSIEDLETTKQLYVRLKISGIELFDHMIVNFKGEFYSFAHEGVLDGYKKEYESLICAGTN